MKHRVVDFFRTFLIFFLLCGFVITCSFLLFFHYLGAPEEQVRPAALFTFGNALILTLLFSAFDTFRRYETVERPSRKIQTALERITEGDFAVVLNPERQDSFGKIMASIDRMTQELSGVETLRTDFIANVSHELKTPLAVIQNYAVLLQSPGLSEGQRLEYAVVIQQTSRDLASLITNILKLNRLENQQIYPTREDFDLAEQLCQCLLQFETVWEDSGIEIETDLQPDVTFRGDPELLRLVWTNLLSNAFKFTPRGGTVSLALSAEPEAVTVTVRDTGIGMSAEIGAHIFEKFYQGDTSHAAKGNGLGLALVKRIMDILGGEITVSSAPGQGSAFTVKLRR